MEENLLLSRKSFLCCILIVLFAFLLAYKTIPDYGITWDEPHYVNYARSFFEKDEAKRLQMLSEPKDFPPLGIYFIGLSLSRLEPALGTVRAMRLPASVAFSLLCGVLFFFALPFSSLKGAVFGTLCFMLMPRVFPEAHFAALDMMTSLLWVLIAACFYKGLERPFYSFLFAFLLGCGLAMRFSLLFVLFPLFAWAFLYCRKESSNNFYALIFLLLPVFFSVISVFWPDTLKQILFYVQANLTRADWDRNPLFYRGVLYRWTVPYMEPARYPWDYPFVMLAVTVPLLVLAVFLAGLFFGGEPFNDEKKRRRSFLFFNLVLPLFLFAAPSVPKYDGVRFYLPFLFFLCVFCAHGMDFVLGALSGYFRNKIIMFLCYVLCVLLLCATFLQSHPYGLSYYNALVGGPGGAYERGFETTYWGDALSKNFLTQIDAGKFKDKRVLFAPFAGDSIVFLQSLGWLPEKFQWEARVFVEDEDFKRFDYIVLQTRQGCFTETAFALLEKGKAAYQLKYYGAPLVSVYKLK